MHTTTSRPTSGTETAMARGLLKPGTSVTVNEHGEPSVRGAIGTIRRGTTRWSAIVELSWPDGRWLGTKRLPVEHLTEREATR